jgi:putative spermidine/putrescine transport system permease protein
LIGRSVMGRVCGGVFIAAVFAFILTPFIYIVFASFNSATLAFPPREVSLQSYWSIPPAFLRAVWVSLIVAAASTCLAIPLGICGALAVTRGRFPGRELVNSFLLSPLLLPMLVLGAALYQFYISVDRVAGTVLTGSLIGLILGHTSFCIPYVTRAVLPVLMQIRPELEEAARDLGASSWYIFTRITVPMIRTGLIAGAALAFLTSFDNFPMSLFLAEGDNGTLPVVIFHYIEFDLKPNVLAMSTLIILISLVAMMVIERMIGLAGFAGVGERRH